MRRTANCLALRLHRATYGIIACKTSLQHGAAFTFLLEQMDLFACVPSLITSFSLSSCNALCKMHFRGGLFSRQMAPVGAMKKENSILLLFPVVCRDRVKNGSLFFYIFAADMIWKFYCIRFQILIHLTILPVVVKKFSSNPESHLTDLTTFMLSRLKEE